MLTIIEGVGYLYYFSVMFKHFHNKNEKSNYLVCITYDIINTLH